MAELGHMKHNTAWATIYIHLYPCYILFSHLQRMDDGIDVLRLPGGYTNIVVQRASLAAKKTHNDPSLAQCLIYVSDKGWG